MHPRDEPRLGSLTVYLTAEARASFLAGNHAGMNALHAQIGMPEITLSTFGSWIGLQFSRPYRPDRLTDLYNAIDGVYYVEPSWWIGDGDDITLREDSTYLFRRAWEDCPAGCIYEHIWIFRVTGETVELLEEYGDNLAVEPITWGRLKDAFR